jgi:Tol biopolymer transport system component
MRAFPFQRRFSNFGHHIFRPSWAPDGRRVVYSDGLQLLIYDRQSRQTTPIANTRDAIYPAWSPDGAWIAFAQLARTDSVSFDCTCIERRLGIVVELHNRVVYRDTPLGEARLKLVRPDGSEQRDVGNGEMPAWTPDSRSLVFRRGLSLWRAAIDGTQAAAILNTEFGEEPAVSPDGQRVAFARLNEVQYDIWVVPLRTQ